MPEEQFTPAPEQFTPEEITAEQENPAYAQPSGLTEIAAEGNLAMAKNAEEQPAILSSSKGKDAVDKDVKTMATMSSNGGISKEKGMAKWGSDWTGITQVGTDDKGNPLYGEGPTQYNSQGQALDRFGNPIGGQTDAELEQAKYDEMSPTEKAIYDMGKEYESTINGLNAQLDASAANSDAISKQIIDNIKAQFAARKAAMETLNKNILGSQKLLGARSGRQRYAPELQTSIIGEEERKGIARLADLDAQMNSLILQAEAAREDKNYARLHEKIALASDLYNQKRQTILDLATLAKQEDEALAAKAQEAREQTKFIQEQFALFGDSIALSLYDLETGEFNEKELEKQSLALGVDSYMLKGMANAKIASMNKLTKEEQTEELNYIKLQQEISMAGMNDDQKAYEYAVSNMDYNGTLFEWIQDQELAKSNPYDLIKKQLEIQILEKELGDTEGGNYDIVKINGEDYLKYENGLTVKASEVFKKEVNPAVIDSGKKQIDQLDYLLNHESLDLAVGPNPITRKIGGKGIGALIFGGIESKIDYFTSGTADFIASTEQMLSGLSLESLIDAKARGATFGALSENEMRILSEAASKLSSPNIRLTDKDGVVIGYNIKEDKFKAIIKEIKYYANLDLKRQMGINYSSFDELIGEVPKAADLINNPDFQGNTIEETRSKILEFYNQQDKTSFNNVGGDTNTAIEKVVAIPEGSSGGQCGRFVNNLTGLGVGDSYQSKLAKMDKSIKYPQPGMVFVMPLTGKYAENGHTGIILSIDNGVATVKDSNWGSDEKVKIHKIPVYKMSGFAYPKKTYA